MEMRQAFAQKLDALMERDERICIIDADLARASGTLSLREKYPERAFDVGVAEANMVSVAAGLSTCGFIPFVTSFGTFASRRVADQVMISVAYAKRPVKIVGTDPGVCAELNGGTHMPFEDMAILCSMPTMVAFEPCDAVQMEKAMEQIAAHDGPVYIRLMRKEFPPVYAENSPFDLFKAQVLTEGTDVTVCASGLMVSKALEAAAALKEEGIAAEVIDVHTWKPLDAETILTSVQKTGAVVTAENHNVIGGLNSMICGLLAAKRPCPVERVGVEDQFGQVGRLEELCAAYGLTAENIIAKVKTVMKRK